MDRNHTENTRDAKASDTSYFQCDFVTPKPIAFSKWAYENIDLFDNLLEEGEWISGEWLALAHGTIYDLEERSPFVAFDLWSNQDRILYKDFHSRCQKASIATVPVLWVNKNPCSIETALNLLGEFGHYSAQDPAEGCVWRCERNGKCKLLAKYVRQNKIDGKYLPENRGGSELWLYQV